MAVPRGLEVLITCIAGLPGSGKSYLAEQLWLSYPEPRYESVWWIDDIEEQSQLPSPHTAQTLEHLIITDPHFCRASTRALVEQRMREDYDTSVEWIFFENDPDQCRANVAHRQRIKKESRKVLGMIHILSKIYTIPDGADVRAVWHPCVDDTARGSPLDTQL